MADDTEYISDLDPILELSPTDSFVVETLEGTFRIQFKDFIIGPDNVSFYEEIAADTLAIVSLSSDVTTLDNDVTNINSGLTGLSAAYNEAIKSGFVYATVDSLGTLQVVTSSSNVASIISTDGGSRIQINSATSLNFDKASITVTLNDSVSSSDVTQDFISYSPVVEDRTATSFKIGVYAVENHFESLALPTAVNATSESISPVTSLNVTPSSITPVTQVQPTYVQVQYDPSGSGQAVQSLTVTNLATPVVSQVTANAVPKSFVNNVTVTNTTFNIMTSNKLGSGQALKNIGINISFRYL